MSNPLLERYAQRLAAANVYKKLQRHWSSRAERAVYRLGGWIERAGCAGLARAYERGSGPLVAWLCRRQSRFVIKHL
jgi:hypothetical protein